MLLAVLDVKMIVFGFLEYAKRKTFFIASQNFTQQSSALEKTHEKMEFYCRPNGSILLVFICKRRGGSEQDDEIEITKL